MKRTHRGHLVIVLSVFLTALALLLGFWWRTSGPSHATGPADVTLGSADNSRRALEELRVIEKGSESVPQYSRDQFGQRWADVDRNGCDTRNDVLKRDLHDLQMKRSSPQCVVVSGVLDDPYTGRQIDFQRGEDSSEAVQIDHVVALANAWKSGAWQWDAARRQDFANDPFNLLAVDGAVNQDKGASSADQWLPSNSAYQCAYVQRQIAVKATWGLGVTRAEKKAMTSVLERCQ